MNAPSDFDEWLSEVDAKSPFPLPDKMTLEDLKTTEWTDDLLGMKVEGLSAGKWERGGVVDNSPDGWIVKDNQFRLALYINTLGLIYLVKVLFDESGNHLRNSTQHD